VHLFILFGASGQHPRVNWSCGGGGGMQVALVEIMAEALSDFSRDIPCVRLSLSPILRVPSPGCYYVFNRMLLVALKDVLVVLFCEA
jgi:hypothetical protein